MDTGNNVTIFCMVNWGYNLYSRLTWRLSQTKLDVNQKGKSVLNYDLINAHNDINLSRKVLWSKLFWSTLQFFLIKQILQIFETIAIYNIVFKIHYFQGDVLIRRLNNILTYKFNNWIDMWNISHATPVFVIIQGK